MFGLGKDAGKTGPPGKSKTGDSGGGGLFGMPAPGASAGAFFTGASTTTPSSATSSSATFSGENPFLKSSSLPSSANLFSATTNPVTTSSGFGTFSFTSPSTNPFKTSVPATQVASNPFGGSSLGVSTAISNIPGSSPSFSTPNIFSTATTTATNTLFPSSGVGIFSAASGPGSETSTSLFSAKSTPATIPIFDVGKENRKDQIFGSEQSASGGVTPTLFKKSSTLFPSSQQTSSGSNIFSGPGGVETNVFSRKPQEAAEFGVFGGNDGQTKSSLFGKSQASTLFGEPKVTGSTMFDRQPDIVKPNLASRLGPPPSYDQQQDDYEEGEIDEDDKDWDGEQEEEGGEEEEHSEQKDEKESVIPVAEKIEIEQTQPPTNSNRRKLIRNLSRDELKTLTCIVCDQVPKQLNNHLTLTKHFSRFGKVVKVTPNIKKMSATVQFSDHKGAKLAKARGKLVHPDIEPIGQIQYITFSPGGKKRIRRSTGGSTFSVDSAADTNKAQPPVPQTKQEQTVAKTARKPFSISRALKPQSVEEQGGGNLEVGVVRNTDSMKQLLSIMKTQTTNHSDRLSVLEARDKYIRLKYPSSVTRSGLDIQHVNLKGTCPDMCPERERYSRSVKNQLRWFEKESGELNHFATIKEHSRSAADQDVPFSHELRPPAILNMTLDYLMCNIVDRIDYMGGSMLEWFSYVENCQEQGIDYEEPMNNFPQANSQIQFSVGDWFEFVWSMLRAVRKDITQQNLADKVSVRLVEKCARFHIFCSERLIEEDAHDFDPKLNNENLTKCLQSLKLMYYDLSLQGEKCENEAEFMAYDILLNLNQGDTMRKVQTFDPELRADDNVKHALKIFNALNSNNYVRFFRLVRQSSYLQMCILKHYFYQVRRTALEMMLRAFVASSGVVKFPVDKIFDLLAFESLRECTSFLRQHGIESEEDSVFLDRAAFYRPDSAPKSSRSYNLIDSKKTTSYGEIMNGGPLPKNPYLTYSPHNSFDKNGYLKVESYEAKDQEGGQTPEEILKQKQEEERRTKIMKASLELTNHILKNFVDDEVKVVGGAALLEARLAQQIRDMYSRMEAEALTTELKDIATAALREAKNAVLMERLAQEQTAEAEISASKDIVEDLVQHNISHVAKESLQEARLDEKSEARISAASAVIDQLITDTAADLAKSVADHVIQEELQNIEKKIKLMQEKRKEKMLRKCFQSWRQLVLKQRKHHQTLDDFPVSAAALSPDQQCHRLRGHRQTSPRVPLHGILSGRQQLDSLLELAAVQKSMYESAALLPFNLVDLLGESTGSLPVFKLLISGDELDEEDDFYVIQQIILSKFRNMFPAQHDHIDTDLLVCRTLPIRNNSILSICVRNITSKHLESALFSEVERRKIFSGTSGILFLHLNTEQDCSERLQAMLMNRPSIPALPLQIITHLPKEEFEQIYNVKQYLDSNLISDYGIHQVSPDLYNMYNNVAISDAVHNLGHNRQTTHPTQDITKKDLQEYVESFVTNQIFGEMLRNRMDRTRKGLPDRCFSDLVKFYNTALEHLSSVLKEKELGEISWPAQEFCSNEESGDLPVSWNDSLYIDQSVQIVNSLQLEEFEVLESDNWRDMIDQVWTYVETIRVDDVDTSALVSKIQRALNRTYRKYADQCSLLGGDTKSVPPPEMLPWTDILMSCAEYRISAMAQSDRRIGYKESTLFSFLLPKEWTSGLSWSSEHGETYIHQHVNNSVHTFRESQIADESCINQNLRDLLSKEQKDSLRYEKKLEDALTEEYIPKSSTFDLDIAELEREEEQLLMMEQDCDDEGMMSDDAVHDDVYDAPLSILSHISPRLGVLMDSPSFLVSHRTRNLSSRSSGQFTPRGQIMETSAWDSGKKRKSDRNLSGEKRVRKNTNYKQDISPGLTRNLTGRLDTLKHSINHEINQSARLEARLREALDN